MKAIISLVFCLCFFSADGQQSNWQLVGQYGPNNSVVTLYGDTVLNKLIITGKFTTFDSVYVYGLCLWDGVNFEGVEDSLHCYTCSGPVSSVRYGDNIYFSFGNEYFVNHDFNGICKWDSSVFSGLKGNDLLYYDSDDGVGNGLNVIDDKLFVTGVFELADNQPATGIAIWDGENWEGLQIPGVNFALMKVACKFNELYYFAGNLDYDDANGINHDDIIAYDGENWYPMSFSSPISQINDMVVYKDELYICGGFKQYEGNAGDKIMKLHNDEWVKVGTTGLGNGGISDMEVFNNELYVVGYFEQIDEGVPAHSIAKWDGQKWCNIDDGFLVTAQVLEVWNNELYVAGGYSENNGQPPLIYKLFKWTGGDYVSQCGEPVAASTPSLPEKNKLHLYPNPTSTNLLTAEYPDWPDESVSVSIFNSMGIPVLRQEVNMSGGKALVTLPESLPPGYYTVSLWCERRGEGVVQRLVRL